MQIHDTTRGGNSSCVCLGMTSQGIELSRTDSTDDADDDGYLQQLLIQINYLKCIKFDGACSLDRNVTNLKLCYN